MHLEIRAGNVELADAMRLHLERRLRFALGRFDDRIRKVTVRLKDLNGPKGGTDQQCRISLDLFPTGRLVLDEQSSDVIVAMDRAADRVGRAVARRIHRVSGGRDDRR